MKKNLATPCWLNLKYTCLLLSSVWLLSLALPIEDMLSFSSYAIFYAIYPELCYLLCHIPRSSAIFFLNVMLQYITLTPSYANSSNAMFSGQSRGRISGYCCNCWEKCQNSFAVKIVQDIYYIKQTLSYFELHYVFWEHNDSVGRGSTVYGFALEIDFIAIY